MSKYTLTYEIWRRSNSRSTSYTWTSVEAVLNRFDIKDRENIICNRVVRCTHVANSKEAAMAFRTAFEAALRVVHRNIQYRVYIR